MGVEKPHFFPGKFCENVQTAVYSKGISRVLGYKSFALLFVIEIPAEEVISLVCDGGKRYRGTFLNHSAVAEIDLLTVFGDITPAMLVALSKEAELFRYSDIDYHL